MLVLFFKGSDDRIHFWYMSKIDVINITNNSNLTKKGVFCQFFVNRANGYYKNDKERIKEQANDKYRNLSKEEKNKKREYGRKKYHNMSKERKKKD